MTAMMTVDQIEARLRRLLFDELPNEDVPDVLRALERVRHELTEAMIRRRPVDYLSRIMRRAR